MAASWMPKKKPTTGKNSTLPKAVTKTSSTSSSSGTRSAPGSRTTTPRATRTSVRSTTTSTRSGGASRPVGTARNPNTSKISKAKEIAAQARKETDPAKKQALLVQRAKLLGGVGDKAKKNLKTLRAKGDAATAEEKAKLARIQERVAAAKGRSGSKGPASNLPGKEDPEVTQVPNPKPKPKGKPKKKPTAKPKPKMILIGPKKPTTPKKPTGKKKLTAKAAKKLYKGTR